MQSEQEHKRKELKEEGIALKGYADSLRIRVETLVKREKSCSEMEDVIESRFDALSGRERACVSREQNIEIKRRKLQCEPSIFNGGKIRVPNVNWKLAIA